MLINDSYRDAAQIREIDQQVGKPFSLRQRWNLGGIGSPKLEILASSGEIRNLLQLDTNRDTCNMEMRPNGVILRFRARLETYALVIPFYKLSLYKGDLGVYTVHCEHHYVRVRADTKAIQRFFIRLLSEKANKLPQGPPPGMYHP